MCLIESRHVQRPSTQFFVAQEKGWLQMPCFHFSLLVFLSGENRKQKNMRQWHSGSSTYRSVKVCVFLFFTFCNQKRLSFIFVHSFMNKDYRKMLMFLHNWQVLLFTFCYRWTMCCISRGYSHICHWYQCGACHQLWPSSFIVLLCPTGTFICLSPKSNWKEPPHSTSTLLLWDLQETLGICCVSDLCDGGHVNTRLFTIYVPVHAKCVQLQDTRSSMQVLVKYIFTDLTWYTGALSHRNMFWYLSSCERKQ